MNPSDQLPNEMLSGGLYQSLHADDVNTFFKLIETIFELYGG